MEFDYGHRVLGHGGRCRFLHGHRGVAEVTVRSGALDALGMVVDFSVVKEKVGGWVDAHWDHSLLLNSADPVIPLLRGAGERFYVMPDGNPTAENMARVLHEAASDLLRPLQVVRVRLFETPHSWADYTG